MKFHKNIKSPVGQITLVATDSHLIAVSWGGHPEVPNESKLSPKHPVLLEAEKQLKEYFVGKRTNFDLPTQAQGTPFQEKVWNTLKKISYGTTWNYGMLAKAIGNPKACRAVGGANGKNPLGIIVPCHRVIGADGSLTGFGGGLKTKSVLLELEKR